MGNARIGLDGNWRVAWTEYQGREPAPPAPQRIAPIPATVPGDVHLDLERQGLLPDLFVGTNLDRAWWIEHKDWWYLTEFDAPADLGEREAILVFHGLDTFASVWLNDELVGKSDNMFIRHEFPVTGKLKAGQQNRLCVRLASCAHSIVIDPDHKPLNWSPERLFCRKAQMSFGWDIAPRLVTAGIWRPVEIVLVDRGRLTGAGPAKVKFKGAAADATVRVDVDWRGKDGEAGKLRGRLAGTEWEIDVKLRAGISTYEAGVKGVQAEAWWPAGYGDPNLVPLSVELVAGGDKIDALERRVGLRTIELVQEPQPGGKQSFYFRCNGKRIFITGLNWTPLDAILARVTPERITRALEDLAGIGCNMLRVWGGGVYESDHFFGECDRLGIMVWQDFMMSCGWYPQTDEMAARIEAEARQVVRDFRHHPSIALWCGDNEIDVFYPKLMPENRLTRRVLAKVCGDLHPEVQYLPSSPMSPESADPNAQTEGDMHNYIHGRAYTDPAMHDLQPRFMSEFGCLSLPSVELIEKYIPRDGRWPLTSAIWRHHAADTIRFSSFRGADMIMKALAAMNRPEPKTIEEAVKVSQEFQTEAVMAWIDRFCRDPGFGGFLIWNVSDCWPQQSDSVTEYGGKPKHIFGKLGPLFAKLKREREKG